MAYSFSPSRLAFYHSSILYPDSPDDLRPVTDERHEELMVKVWTEGKTIIADADGNPDIA